MTAETITKPDTVFRSARGLLGRLELPGDALLSMYFAVFVRQYLWWCTGRNGPAWVAAALVAVIGCFFYISSKETTDDRTSQRAWLPFWLVAVLPLVFVYSMRVVFPDVSFDVLNYRLLHAERALRGFLYLPGEFFPTPAPYNPAPDMVTGIFRHALGYRLGTFANLLAMIWVARVTDKLLRPFLRDAWLRAGGVLLAVMAEHMLFEINNYMADLLALPLLLEATYLALRDDEMQTVFKHQRRTLVCIALLLGMSVAFKLTNAAVALPIVLLCAYRALYNSRGDGKKCDEKKATRAKEFFLTTVLCAAAFILPLVPFSAYLYRETGSPFFPVFNGVFKSAYWPASNVWDPRWGPKGLWEKLAWPILISFKPERLSELTVYSGRISFAFAAALAGFLIVRRDKRLREVCFLVVTAALLWSASTGYIRYALYVEVMAAIVVLALAAKLATQTVLGNRRVAFAIACVLCIGLVVQACLASYYISRQEWAGRPTILSQPRTYRHEIRYLLRDRSLRDFVCAETLNRIDHVEVWIVSGMKTTGIEVMLRPEAPMIGINTYEYFRSEAGRERFDRAIAHASGKRMFSLVLAENIETAKADLERRGLVAGEIVPVEIPFYSPPARIRAFLIEVAPSTEGKPVATKETAGEPGTALANGAYRANISATTEPGAMKAGAKEVLQIKVKNAGTGIWRSRVSQGWMDIVTVGNRWLSGNGQEVVNELDSRSALSHDLKPGEEADIVLTVTAPKKAGQYVLEIDMVHEGVTWFYQRGSPTLRWNVKVEK